MKKTETQTQEGGATRCAIEAAEGNSKEKDACKEPCAPRGIRNNNPLNIRRSKALLAGRRETVTDTAFEEFRKLLYGYLAALQLIGRYMTRHHLYTPSGIINRWAPPTENQTNKYLDFVCRETGIGGQENLSLYDKRLKALVKAMAIMENGRRWVDETHDAAIEQAWGMWVE